MSINIHIYHSKNDQFEKKLKNAFTSDLIIVTSGPEVKFNKGVTPMLYEVTFINPEGKEMKLLFAIPKYVDKEKYIKASLFKMYGKNCELKDYKKQNSKNW